MTKKLAKTVKCMASETGRRVDAGRMPSARLIYTPAAPWAISLELQNGSRLENGNRRVVVWTISRELLHQVLVVDPAGEPAGDGDVRVSVDGTEVRLELSSPSGHVTLWMPYVAVHEFLAVTLHEVPLDTESDHVDWDRAIEQLLHEEGAQS